MWPWYGNEKPGLGQAEQWAKFMGDSWRFHGVHKWIAYDRVSGEVAGRGGLSRTPDDDWGQIYALLPAQPWVRDLRRRLAVSDRHEPVRSMASCTLLARYLHGCACGSRPRSPPPPLYSWLVRLETGMMILVKLAADLMFGLGSALVCVGSVSNLIAMSQDWDDYKDLPWRARFVAVNRRHPRLRGTAMVCLAAAIVLYIGVAVTHFA